MLLTFAGLEVQAQTSGASNVLQSGAVMMKAPELEQICTFEPTYKDVYHYKKADQRLLKQSERLKTATFNLTYQVVDENGEIVNGARWPDEAISAFEYAITIWETHISSPIPIRVRANWADLEDNTLGSAGPTLVYPIEETFYPIAQASAIVGEDLLQGNQFGEEYEINVNMNSSFDSWYYGTDANTPAGQIDFVTVVLHEIGHGLGFLGSMAADEEQEVAAWGIGEQFDPIIYDRFVMDGFGNDIINESVYPNPSNELFEAVTGNREGLFFIGDESNEAFGDLPVPLYSPAQWTPGSSFSHLDLNVFSEDINMDDALMRPQIDNAFAVHSPGPVMCGMFADKGWPLAGGCLALLGAQSQVAVNQTEYEFGVTNAGTKLEETFTISNIDTENPLVGRIEVASGGYAFSLDEEVVFMDIEPGAELETPISYYPLYAREASGEIRISHNGSNLPSPIIISLEGEALEEDKVVELNQNYPNPFNATTNIPYTIPQDSYVRLEIYDILGQKIQTLVDENQQRGKYVARLNANEFSSGVYLYRILVQGTAETGKLMLVK
ncbi:MAG: T9SS type A sorting domain-containing protein [Gracilimonas sp.]